MAGAADAGPDGQQDLEESENSVEGQAGAVQPVSRMMRCTAGTRIYVGQFRGVIHFEESADRIDLR